MISIDAGAGQSFGFDECGQFAGHGQPRAMDETFARGGAVAWRSIAKRCVCHRAKRPMR